jgi:SAM-dependent methyltransferase
MRDKLNKFIQMVHPKVDYFEFYNELASKYPEEQIVYESPIGKEREQVILPFISQLKGLTLEVGCNAGHYSKYFSEYVGLDIARANLRKFDRDRIQSLGQATPFRDDAFQNVFMSETLEHIPKPIVVLRELRRILKPGGSLLVTVPYGYNSRNVVWFDILEEYGISKTPYLHANFNGFTLGRLLKKAKFEVSSMERPLSYQLVALARKN